MASVGASRVGVVAELEAEAAERGVGGSEVEGLGGQAVCMPCNGELLWVWPYGGDNEAGRISSRGARQLILKTKEGQ